jgi:hypothetical protein
MHYGNSYSNNQAIRNKRVTGFNIERYGISNEQRYGLHVVLQQHTTYKRVVEGPGELWKAVARASGWQPGAQGTRSFEPQR